MKKSIILFLSVLLCLGVAGCGVQKTEPSDFEQSLQHEQTDGQTGTQTSEKQTADLTEPESASINAETAELTEAGERKVKLTIEGQKFDVTLYDNPAANALYDMLPIELTFEDFNGIEKIAYIDGELPSEGEGDRFDPDTGDLCLYVPWGNLSIFYKDFSSSEDLISLGHIDSGIDIIGNKSDTFFAVLERDE